MPMLTISYTERWDGQEFLRPRSPRVYWLAPICVRMGEFYIPSVRGKCLAWDFTSPDTLAHSHLAATRSQSSAAAEHAAGIKSSKYQALSSSHHFVPIAVETLGPWNAEGASFISTLGRRMAEVTGEPRETAFLFQRISMAVQRGNAAAILDTLPPTEETD